MERGCKSERIENGELMEKWDDEYILIFSHGVSLELEIKSEEIEKYLIWLRRKVRRWKRYFI